MLQSTNLNNASNQSPSTNVRKDDGATHAPEAVGARTLRSSYEIERLRSIVFRLTELLWLEESHKKELFDYNQSAGTLFVPFEDDGINPFIDRSAPLPKGSFKWSDYQIQVGENMRGGLKVLQCDIISTSKYLLR